MRAADAGPLWAIVPVKPFGEAKTRLKPVLDDEPRSVLAVRLLNRTLLVLSQVAGIDVLAVASRDEQALSIARDAGVRALRESGEPDLNHALQAAIVQAMASGAGSLLVIASDLPLLEQSDVRALIRAADSADLVIAPDRHGTGTNAMLLRPPDLLTPAFGIGSYQRHFAAGHAAGVEVQVVRTDGLGFDLDQPSDYDDLRRLAPMQWDGAALVAG